MSCPPLTAMPPTALETAEDYQAAADFLDDHMRRIVAVSPWMNPRVTRGVFSQLAVGLPEGYVPPPAVLAPPSGWCEVDLPVSLNVGPSPPAPDRDYGIWMTTESIGGGLPALSFPSYTVTIGPAWVGRAITRWVLTILRYLEVL